jgi:predicted nucleic acid-binding Zn ribbon protein
MVGSGPADERRKEPQALGEVIRGVLGSGPMRSGMALGRLARSWDSVVGKRLAERSTPMRLERGGLVVSAASSSWAAQVTFLSQEIRRRANHILGSEEIRSVRVLVDGGDQHGSGRTPWRPGGVTPQ